MELKVNVPYPKTTFASIGVIIASVLSWYGITAYQNYNKPNPNAPEIVASKQQYDIGDTVVLTLKHNYVNYDGFNASWLVTESLTQTIPFEKKDDSTIFFGTGDKAKTVQVIVNVTYWKGSTHDSYTVSTLIAIGQAVPTPMPPLPNPSPSPNPKVPSPTPKPIIFEDAVSQAFGKETSSTKLVDATRAANVYKFGAIYINHPKLTTIADFSTNLNLVTSGFSVFDKLPNIYSVIGTEFTKQVGTDMSSTISLNNDNRAKIKTFYERTASIMNKLGSPIPTEPTPNFPNQKYGLSTFAYSSFVKNINPAIQSKLSKDIATVFDHASKACDAKKPLISIVKTMKQENNDAVAKLNLTREQVLGFFNDIQAEMGRIDNVTGLDSYPNLKAACDSVRDGLLAVK